MAEVKWETWLRIAAAVGLVAGSIWTIAVMSNRVQALEDWHLRTTPILTQSIEDGSKIDSLNDTVKRIDDNVNWIVHQMITQQAKP